MYSLLCIFREELISRSDKVLRFFLPFFFFSLFLSHAWGRHLNDLADKGAARYIDDTTSKQCDRTCFEQWDEEVGQTWLTKADVCKRGREPESKVDSHSSSVTLSLFAPHLYPYLGSFHHLPHSSFTVIPLHPSLNIHKLSHSDTC